MLGRERKSVSVSVGGKEITFETGMIARQAGGSVMLKCGDTHIMSTACSAPSADDIDFLPMRVDYVERFSSAGKTLGGYLKREGRPTERETLVCRLTDRPIRPMFEKGYYDELQLITSVMSYDGETAPEPLAICAASAALVISDIPLIKPIAAVRVGFVNDEFVINPTVSQQEVSRLDLILAGTADAILMTEGFADFFSEAEMLEAVDVGHAAIKEICQALSEWQNVVGKEKNRSTLRFLPDGLMEDVHSMLDEPIKSILTIQKKAERDEKLSELNKSIIEKFHPEEGEPKYKMHHLKMALKKATAKRMREKILSEKKRVDGRNLNQVRPIEIELDPLPRTHGSVVFTRGETQAIAVCTLGNAAMGQRYEDLNDAQGLRRFYLQYSFPPYSVGEVGRMGPPGRREVGHGKLAERSLQYSIPDNDTFPYTIRLESNITESNGSSSMATVCGGCIAMMRGGVPIERPVAGIAMGLILEDNSFAVLSDILGMEDALGDMDFKIAGGEKGITAFQLDIKIEGINREIMETALAQAREGRLHILSKMLEACPTSNAAISVYAPKLETMRIKPSKIGAVIGPGGKVIRAIIEDTGCEIDIDDDGIVSFSSTDQDAIDKAKEEVYNITADVELDKVYDGKVVSIKDFGLFVSVIGGKEGLCHISEVRHERIDDLTEHFKEGDPLQVKVLEINDRGQIRLSAKVLLPKPERKPREDKPAKPRPPQDENKPRPGILKPPPIKSVK
ncbi:MAG: Polyribonucleotide nucleotidyltransferase [Chlamydiia bacterium]|nr:Polyribonucleotide nucleotidyltransferase [Chlamydiia bacterium]MCH9615959.1 Polyribonucleotide nucleotidyltransferase [Chlamydiia bacterium]MCH9628638.1 Polyribonucleotide nucleotidyltransferase [Chlamydiia bacterium]